MFSIIFYFSDQQRYDTINEEVTPNLCELARQGVTVERKPRPITVYKLDILEYDEEKRCGRLEIACSKGTYIRTVINDIGDSLGCGGIMTSLVRTCTSGFNLDDCFTFEEVENAVKNGNTENLLISIDSAFMLYPEIHLGEHQTKLYKNGVKLDLQRIRNILPQNDKYRVYGSDNKFIGLALAEHEGNILKVYKNLV